jgi:hypothetical protein
MAKGKSMRKSSRKNQKIYKMKGCSKKTLKNKKYLGGSTTSAADVNLAYTGKPIQTVPNPFLAYTGKGGSSCSSNLTPSLAIPVNTNAADKTLPNTGPVSLGGLGTPFLNPQGAQRGGGCGCGMPLLSGGAKRGGCGPLCAVGFMVGGKHRVGCKCSSCKMSMKGGNKGIPYPDGLVGSPMTSQPSGWPGVDGIQGDRNYIAPNNYHTDVQTAMISTGAQPPFSIGGSRKSRKQKGGTLSNFMAQDLINLGRQFSFGLGSAYNALSGYSAPTNPMPWKGQLPNTPSLSTMRNASL